MNRASFAEADSALPGTASCKPCASKVSLDAARARLAELEAAFTIEKAQVEAMKTRLFVRRRGHFQRCDRLRLVVGYRRKYLESLLRQGEKEAGKIA